MAVDPQDQQEINKLYQEYIRLLQVADGLSDNQARIQADAAKAAGNLTNEIKRLNKELDDTLFKSDYLFRSFQETTAELKNQNVLLQIGKSAFKELTNIASTLTYYQAGITDLTEKQFKNQKQNLDISKLELETIKQRLSNTNGEYNRQNLLNRLTDLKRNNNNKLTKEQEKLLKQLEKEKGLLLATNDALEEGLPSLKEELEISKQIYKVKKDIGGLASAAAGVVSKYGGSLAQFLNINDAVDSVNDYNRNLIDGALKSKEVIDEMKRIEDDRITTLQNSLDIQQDINDIIKKIADTHKRSTQEISLQNQLNNVQNQLATANLKDHQSLLIQQTQLTQQLQDIENNRVNNIAVLQNQLQQKQNDLLQDEITSKQKLANLDKQENKVKQDAINSVNTLGNKFKSLGVLISGLAGGLKKGLTDPLTIIVFFIDKALEANTQVVELGKSLGYGVGRAEAFRENLADIARTSNNINVTAKSLTKSFNELVQATGLAYEFTEDQLVTQIKLTEQIGLQADEAAQIQRLGVLNNKTSEDTYKSFIRGLVATRNQLKVGINFKAALSDALKVSGQLAANLGYNPERIAKAVVTAKALGVTLEQVARSGESLLNFESSIDNELQAELLTGKELNLERARAAALVGDQVTLAEELSKNIGTAADFTKMNVLQQNQLAAAVGMTSDQLSETLRKREEAIASGKSLTQINEKEAKQALERQNIQDKFNAAILKLQDIVGNLVAGPFGQLIDTLTNVVGIVSKALMPIFQGLAPIIQLALLPLQGIASILEGMAPVLKVIVGALGGYYLMMKSILVISKAKALWDSISLVSIKGQISAFPALLSRLGTALGLSTARAAAETTAAEALSFGTATIWILGGLAAVMGAVAAYKADDMASFGDGYGKRTLLAPEGAIRLNDKDTVIAGTKLVNNKNTPPSPIIKESSSPIDLNPLIKAIENKEFSSPVSLDPLMKVIENKEEKQPKIENKIIPSPSYNNINTPSIIDLNPMILAINEVKTAVSEVTIAVNNMKEKPINLNMDGRKVGTGNYAASYKSA